MYSGGGDSKTVNDLEVGYEYKNKLSWAWVGGHAISSDEDLSEGRTVLGIWEKIKNSICLC